MDSPWSLIAALLLCGRVARGGSAPVLPIWPQEHTPARLGEPDRGVVGISDAAEAVDLGLQARAHLVVAHAEALLGGQAEHADLALVGVLVHVERGLPDLL